MQQNNNQRNNQHYQLYEGLEVGDLARLISPELHIDEFKSKMGEDADIIVLNFVVIGKEPATDLMNFIERGYDWVLDSDVSAGELDNGDYVVFVELERTPESAGNIYNLIENLMNLTDQNISEWSFKYRKNPNTFEITEENLKKHVPLTPDAYIAQYGEEESDDEEELDLPSDDEVEDELDSMLETARVPVVKKAPVNDYTESLRIAAGIK